MPIINTSSGIKAGTVAHFAAASAPPGWLKANGATVSRSAYAALFLAIGTTYGAGDGATTFAIPDLRAEFLRCLDDGKGVDTGRGVGTAQAQDTQPHNHIQRACNGAAGSGDSSGSLAIAGYPIYIGVASNINTLGTTTAFGSLETRPRNIAMLACIKY